MKHRKIQWVDQYLIRSKWKYYSHSFFHAIVLSLFRFFAVSSLCLSSIHFKWMDFQPLCGFLKFTCKYTYLYILQSKPHTYDQNYVTPPVEILKLHCDSGLRLNLLSTNSVTVFGLYRVLKSLTTRFLFRSLHVYLCSVSLLDSLLDSLFVLRALSSLKLEDFAASFASCCYCYCCEQTIWCKLFQASISLAESKLPN